VTTELITCKGFGGVGLSSGSSSRLGPPKEYLWSILHVIIRAIVLLPRRWKQAEHGGAIFRGSSDCGMRRSSWNALTSDARAGGSRAREDVTDLYWRQFEGHNRNGQTSTCFPYLR